MAGERNIESDATSDEGVRQFEEQAQKYEAWAAATSDPSWKAAYDEDAARMRAFAALVSGDTRALDKFYKAYPIPDDPGWYRVLIRVLEFLGGMKYQAGYTLYRYRVQERKAL